MSIFAQLTIFSIHNHSTELIDALVKSSLTENFFHVTIIIPLLVFIVLQIFAYILFIGFVWFLAVSCHEAVASGSDVNENGPYYLGIFLWFVGTVAIFSLNHYYFPHSFFANYVHHEQLNYFFLMSSSLILVLASSIAYYHLYRTKRYLFTGATYLLLVIINIIIFGYNHYYTRFFYRTVSLNDKPTVILIGLDSLRPDFTSYFGNRAIHTPHIDAFLRGGAIFTDAYTPLARTFPSWVSILTGKHPKNSHARINLGYPAPIIRQDTVAKHFKAIGYETIYATDERRFSNLTFDYGFDEIVGPKMGLNDFILGGLSDFPLTNLMVNLPFGRFLFPYNYANRAAAVTYDPAHFLQLVEMTIRARKEKPLFLAVHFCLTHWPFSWASDRGGKGLRLDQRYQRAVEKVDQQLGELMQILKDNGLLEHSLVVLLSDHGTTLGLPNDRSIDKKHYRGDPKKINWIPVNKINTAAELSLNLKHDYRLDTSYGQGTDILSLKQYRVLLAFKSFGFSLPSQLIKDRSSLLDIAPTILDLLHLSPMQGIDGVSLVPSMLVKKRIAYSSRSFYLETGYSVADLQSSEIAVNKVIKHSLGLYQLNPQNGYLHVKSTAEKSVIKSKQRALLLGDWLLARYPASYRNNIFSKKVFSLPAYYVLANIKTGQWTIDLNSTFAKTAPLKRLKKEFDDFYGDEI